MEWFKRFSHLECLCVCVSMCVCKFVCRSSVPTASEKKGFCEKHKAGEVMATGRRRSTRLLCSLLLVFVTSPAVKPEVSGVETLRQGALARLDPRIEPQQVAGHVALVVLESRPPPLCFAVVLSSQDGDGVPLAERQLVLVLNFVIPQSVHGPLVHHTQLLLNTV